MPERLPHFNSATIAWWLWVLGQAGVIALFAGRVRLSGGYPTPVEATADVGLAVAQILLAVLLGRGLRDRLPATAMAGVVFATLAGRLSTRPWADSVELVAITAAWVAAILIWSPHRLANFTVAFLTFAGPVLFYVAAEYGASDPSLKDWPWPLSPVLGICSIAFHAAPLKAFAVPIAVLVVSTIVFKRLKTPWNDYCKSLMNHE